ncbi:MAG: DUF3343 domain-containing protein [Clostridiaceae bacterium]|jgi:hypothetical protein|nr:DUF3343 domain-containing protein [Clostridiaceae bacterium]
MIFVATFHTHYGAISFLRKLQQMGDDRAEMIPAPRKLSVSCGSAVRFYIPFDQVPMADDDTEGVYCDENGRYTKIFTND